FSTLSIAAGQQADNKHNNNNKDNKDNKPDGRSIRPGRQMTGIRLFNEKTTKFDNMNFNIISNAENNTFVLQPNIHPTPGQLIRFGGVGRITQLMREKCLGNPTSIAHLDHQKEDPGRILIGSSDLQSRKAPLKKAASMMSSTSSEGISAMDPKIIIVLAISAVIISVIIIVLFRKMCNKQAAKPTQVSANETDSSIFVCKGNLENYMYSDWHHTAISMPPMYDTVTSRNSWVYGGYVPPPTDHSSGLAAGLIVLGGYVVAGFIMCFACWMCYCCKDEQVSKIPTRVVQPSAQPQQTSVVKKTPVVYATAPVLNAAPPKKVPVIQAAPPKAKQVWTTQPVEKSAEVGHVVISMPPAYDEVPPRYTGYCVFCGR
ncbi:hypothetical protein PRIPAC_91952, partial [Pristionchus pacificus]|uniref:Uncharacterized protein n=1 Tax=Pristionchus pacificus TaxID=54126 RepID=A0A2A6CV85_PRIPA